MTDAPQAIARLLRQVHADDRTWSDDPEERELLLGDARKCVDYLVSQHWCTAVLDTYLAYGVGGIFSLFLVRLDADPGVDEWLWCVVGDVPSAYLVIDETETPADAIEIYAELMEAWARSVLRDDDADVFPVTAPRTATNAHALLTRVELIRGDLLPECRSVAS